MALEGPLRGKGGLPNTKLISALERGEDGGGDLDPSGGGAGEGEALEAAHAEAAEAKHEASRRLAVSRQQLAEYAAARETEGAC